MTIAGYEHPPVGRLLEQHLELRGAIGLAYERAIGLAKPLHVHDRAMLACPRGTCRMTVGTARERFAVDATQVLWMPEGVAHDNACDSAIYDTLALFPAAATLDRAFAAHRSGDSDRMRLRGRKRCRVARGSMTCSRVTSPNACSGDHRHGTAGSCSSNKSSTK